MFRPSNSSRVSVYLGGVDVQEVTWVPYSRVVYSEEESESEIRIAETHMVRVLRGCPGMTKSSG